jgi:hypothetical protein
MSLTRIMMHTGSGIRFYGNTWLGESGLPQVLSVKSSADR